MTSDEPLDDDPAVSTSVSGRLNMFVEIEVERELLRGYLRR